MISDSLLKELGILDWGYSEDSVASSYSHYETWADSNLSKPLEYLSDHRKDLRRDIKLVYPEFQSALVFLFSYQSTKKWLLDNNQYRVAAYTLAYEGEDYHFHLRRRLSSIEAELKAQHPGLETFVSLDIQPILERDLAYRAGLGWFGKNSMIINQKEGSYFIIGSLLLNQKLNLVQKKPDIDHCGQCTACVDACPTVAIDARTRTITAEKCISTFTIEMMKEVPAPEGYTDSRGEIFGCDICQDVCPWNKKVLNRVTGFFHLNEKFSFLKDWFLSEKLDELKGHIDASTNRGFRKKLQGTVFDRPGRIGWLKNLRSYFVQPK